MPHNQTGIIKTAPPQSTLADFKKGQTSHGYNPAPPIMSIFPCGLDFCLHTESFPGGSTESEQKSVWRTQFYCFVTFSPKATADKCQTQAETIIPGRLFNTFQPLCLLTLFQMEVVALVTHGSATQPEMIGQEKTQRPSPSRASVSC